MPTMTARDSRWPERQQEPGAAVPKLPAAPTLRGALRESISDFYFNSWRLIPANLI